MLTRQIGKQGKAQPSYDRRVSRYGRNRNGENERVVRYSEFDQGTRAEYNARIIAGNAERAHRIVQRVDHRIARVQFTASQYRSSFTSEAYRRQQQEVRRQREKELFEALKKRARRDHLDLRLKSLEDSIDWQMQLIEGMDENQQRDERRIAKNVLFEFLEKRRGVLEFAKVQDEITAARWSAQSRDLERRIKIADQIIENLKRTAVLLHIPANRAIQRGRRYELRYYLEQKRALVREKKSLVQRTHSRKR